tara:strand:+ start:35 stop:1456 length:1422 start_codon:yes stop_codon:yes gene_type:complete
MAITSVTSSGLTPSPRKQTLASAYIDFATAGSSDGWAQQYLPDLMAQEAEIFGNRTISGFLSQVGAEEGMQSDQVVWSEQGRLHLSYKNCTVSSNTVTIVNEVGGHTSASTHGIRPGDMVLISDASATIQAFVASVGADNIVVLPYKHANIAGAGVASTTNVSVVVYGSEYVKGAVGRAGANEPTFQSYNNKPIIIKDKYEISGSDASQIGWVEVSGEEGQNGYLWYLKAEGDTRSRFTDYLEMAMIESVKATVTFSATETGAAGVIGGTEGLFSAIEARGNQSSGVTGVNAATDLAEFDAILAEFDKNGAIEENMLFCDRSTALAVDDMLASMNSHGAGGTSYGVFNNDEDMALNLGFSGFRRGSYDFYKTDWKYLNDLGTRGGMIDTVGNVRGVIVPAGVSSVYDQGLGKNLKRPFLHVRYRASSTDDRKLKTWTTGSVGATTSDLDAMEVHYLSERCLVVQGANNFMLLN